MYESNPYQQKQILDAKPEDTLLQLFQGAIVRIKQAMDHAEQNEKALARGRRQQAFQIIAYLDGTLDRENGGEIAEELEALYAYMQREITESTRKDDFERLASVEEVLNSLYEGFKDAVVEYKESQKSKSKQAGYVEENGQQSRIGAVG